MCVTNSQIQFYECMLVVECSKIRIQNVTNSNSFYVFERENIQTHTERERERERWQE